MDREDEVGWCSGGRLRRKPLTLQMGNETFPPRIGLSCVGGHSANDGICWAFSATCACVGGIANARIHEIAAGDC
jgi:hypothetical protein